MSENDYRVTTVYLDKETRAKLEELMAKHHLDKGRGRSAIIRKAVDHLYEKEISFGESYKAKTMCLKT